MVFKKKPAEKHGFEKKQLKKHGLKKKPAEKHSFEKKQLKMTVNSVSRRCVLLLHKHCTHVVS